MNKCFLLLVLLSLSLVACAGLGEKGAWDEAFKKGIVEQCLANNKKTKRSPFSVGVLAASSGDQ